MHLSENLQSYGDLLISRNYSKNAVTPIARHSKSTTKVCLELEEGYYFAYVVDVLLTSRVDGIRRLSLVWGFSQR